MNTWMQDFSIWVQMKSQCQGQNAICVSGNLSGRFWGDFQRLFQVVSGVILENGVPALIQADLMKPKESWIHECRSALTPVCCALVQDLCVDAWNLRFSFLITFFKNSHQEKSSLLNKLKIFKQWKKFLLKI